ncbi:SAGA histone acetylase and TREX-2 complexes component [Tilletia horrida]|uniref:SAGA histone acetylase and TREX-2 complexes component n=1 Tax=Tilletia horrida TaxID=155126 RepID=A0AAN6JU85_9BASI|nr:SAGA histone acetylase and TREX-2 complexes component [Tilletia horrida]
MTSDGGHQPPQDVAASQAPPEDDIAMLFTALHQRMVQSGDWNRVLTTLRRMLEDCGYEETLQKFAAEQAREQERLQLGPLLAVLSPYAKENLPAHVRDHIGALIRDFLDRNVEDANPEDEAEA